MNLPFSTFADLTPQPQCKASCSAVKPIASARIQARKLSHLACRRVILHAIAIANTSQYLWYSLCGHERRRDPRASLIHRNFRFTASMVRPGCRTDSISLRPTGCNGSYHCCCFLASQGFQPSRSILSVVEHVVATYLCSLPYFVAGSGTSTDF